MRIASLVILIVILAIAILLAPLGPREFLIGAVVGVLTDIAVGLFFLFDEFSSSTAIHRVRKVAEATREILNSGTRCRLRDRYRYSLGVVIDRFDKTFGKAREFQDDEWPCLVHHTGGQEPQLSNRHRQTDGAIDRWDFFEQHVRPVIEDVESFSFIGRYSHLAGRFCKEIHQLSALARLCNQLENVMCNLDAAFEGKSLVRLCTTNGIVVVQPIDSSNEVVERLREEYRKLHIAWRDWLHVVGLI
jgi:hypothetical protein